MSDLESENYCRIPTENPDMHPGFVAQKPEPIPEEIMAKALDIALAIIEAEKRGYERGIEDAANYCEGHVMGISIQRNKPHSLWVSSPADKMGTHSGKGYATAIRALKEKA